MKSKLEKNNHKIKSISLRILFLYPLIQAFFLWILYHKMIGVSGGDMAFAIFSFISILVLGILVLTRYLLRKKDMKSHAFGWFLSILLSGLVWYVLFN